MPLLNEFLFVFCSTADAVRHPRPHRDRLQADTAAKASAAFHHISAHQLNAGDHHRRRLHTASGLVRHHSPGPHSVADDRVPARAHADRQLGMHVQLRHHPARQPNAPGQYSES